MTVLVLPKSDLDLVFWGDLPVGGSKILLGMLGNWQLGIGLSPTT